MGLNSFAAIDPFLCVFKKFSRCESFTASVQLVWKRAFVLGSVWNGLNYGRFLLKANRNTLCACFLYHFLLFYHHHYHHHDHDLVLVLLAICISQGYFLNCSFDESGFSFFFGTHLR